MAKQLYTNNAASTLASGIGAGDTALTVASGEGALFASPANGDWQIVTLSDGEAHEIVKVTGRTADVLTVVRAQEGTAASVWLTGATVEARLTAGMLGNLPFDDNGHANGLALGGTAHAGVNTPAFVISTSVARGQILLIGATVCVVVNGGVTGATTPDPTITSYSAVYTTQVFTSGDAILSPVVAAASVFASVALGGTSFASENSVSVGAEAVASAAKSVAIGWHAQALSSQAVAIGDSALARNRCVAIGAEAQALASDALAMGRAAKAATPDSLAVGLESHTERAYQLHFVGHQTLGRDNWNAGSGSQYNAGTESMFGSIWMDLGTPQTWVGSTVYTEGAVVRPTTPNGYQYRLWHGLYDAAALPNTATSTVAEPTWPTAIEAYIEADANSDHYWIAADLSVGADEVIPAGMVFYPSEIGFICYTYSGVTAAPFVSIGTAASPTLLVNNQQLSDITAAQMRHAFNGLHHGITDLRIKLITPATGASARFHGRFYAKGIFVQTQG